MSEKKKVFKAAGVVGAATLLSRILGFIRDMVFAAFFGTGIYADAFVVAFRIPNLLRRLFAEGSLSIAFIPVFSDYLAHQGRDEAFHMARSVIHFFSILLVLVTLAGILSAPVIVHLISPGFGDSPEKLELTIALTRLMFPYIFFIGLVALAMGILNSLGHFATPALAPVFLNVAMISAMGIASLITSSMVDRVYWLAFGVLAGGVLQLALQIPVLVRKGFYFWHKATRWHPGLIKIAKLMGPAVFGAAVYQVNILANTLLASLLPEGSVTYLYFADRLVQFPLAIFAISTATAVLPSLSRQAAVNDLTAMQKSFAEAINFVFFITLPSMMGLIVLREPIIALLLQRGAFTSEATRMTGEALLYYALGLWAFSAVRIAVATFYALKDTKTPVKIAMLSITVNILLGIVLMRPLLHGGLALSTSLASMVNLVLLLLALKKKLGSLNLHNMLNATLKSFVATIGMGLCVVGSARLMRPLFDKGGMLLLPGITGCVIVGIIFYGVLAYLLKSRELTFVLSMVGRKRIQK